MLINQSSSFYILSGTSCTLGAAECLELVLSLALKLTTDKRISCTGMLGSIREGKGMNMLFPMFCHHACAVVGRAKALKSSPLCSAGGKGFSFATWLRLEDATFQPGTAGRSLFNLIHRSTEEVRGLSAAMKGVCPCASPARCGGIADESLLQFSWYRAQCACKVILLVGDLSQNDKHRRILLTERCCRIRWPFAWH